jgi:hypothetical protein
MNPKQHLAQFLLAIPQSNQDPQRLAELAQAFPLAPISLLEGAALLLHTLGVVDYDAVTQTIRARSQTAKYALNSMAAYVESDIRIVEDWKTRGVEQGFLENGASFLHALEQRRLQVMPQPTPSRRERVAQVLIKRENPQTGDPELYFQYDANAKEYQLIGGRWSPRDGDDLRQTMIREIEEELAGNPLRYGEQYQLTLIAADLTLPATLSPTFGALTEYHFYIYHLVDLTQELQMQPGDRWVPITQVQGGAVIDEEGCEFPFGRTDIYKAIDALLPNGLAHLANSFRRS